MKISRIISEYTWVKYIGIALIHFGSPPAPGAFTNALLIGTHSNRFAKKNETIQADTKPMSTHELMLKSVPRKMRR